MDLREMIAAGRAEAAEAGDTDPNTSYRLGLAINGLEIAVRALAYAGIGERFDAGDLGHILGLLLRVETDRGERIHRELGALADLADAERGLLFEALRKEYGGGGGYPNWPAAMAAVLEEATPGSRVEAIACEALITLAPACEKEVFASAWERVGVEVCVECQEPIGIGCAAPHQCPTCAGHGRVRGRQSYDPDCADCRGSGLRKDYERFLAAKTEAAA